MWIWIYRQNPPLRSVSRTWRICLLRQAITGVILCPYTQKKSKNSHIFLSLIPFWAELTIDRSLWASTHYQIEGTPGPNLLLSYAFDVSNMFKIEWLENIVGGRDFVHDENFWKQMSFVLKSPPLDIHLTKVIYISSKTLSTPLVLLIPVGPCVANISMSIGLRPIFCCSLALHQCRPRIPRTR